ncbi:hypothetical protein SAMN02745172_02672 [Pseudoxanthobacter soli DSM 19599]|uniref:DNA gyrase inhibitor YacG n=1 Tax=Pseudoxanthobacter soli DSM 19599 TaxID=1123029 RepID=A0A1M7ZMI4_9HYPH|nr:DNA gyrase inhibitor YacG [Pseudoxanthobacter soli]SHO66022.1 hypothetical protein SAMN02745172_02672 [Pseudoxanthobacter soli DSM 19599]
MSGADEAPENAADERKFKPCPICGKLAVKAYHPFCSKRCADVDLNRWLSGRYVIPGRAVGSEDEGDDS